MNLREDLEIVLITYNRKEHLKNTLTQIFAENSPIKDLDITILDNKSTDGSSELIQEYIQGKSNVKHVRHNRNIGGNGNIARAFEVASKKYVWVLCDDDEYIWDNWDVVVKGLEQDSDVIFTELSMFEHYKNDASIMRAATFLPATIYKTELITDDVMQNAMASIINLFPHLAIMSQAMNENKKIYIPEKAVVSVGNRPSGQEEEGFFRGASKPNVHPYVREMFLIVGYINSVQMIKDKKRRAFIINNMSAKKTGFFREISANFKRNRLYYDNSLKNVCDVFAGIDCGQKLQFMLSLVWLDFVYVIKKYIFRKYK